MPTRSGAGGFTAADLRRLAKEIRDMEPAPVELQFFLTDPKTAKRLGLRDGDRIEGMIVRPWLPVREAVDAE